MKRILSLFFSLLLAVSVFAVVPVDAFAAGPLYLVNMIENGEASVDMKDSQYTAYQCSSSNLSGAVRIGSDNGTTFTDYNHGFRYHAAGENGISITFTVPQGYNTFSGRVGVCYHVPGPQEGATTYYKENCSISVQVDDVTEYISPTFKAHCGYSFEMRADAGSTVKITLYNYSDSSYAHVVFGDPQLTTENYPDVKLAFEKSYYKAGDEVRTLLTGSEAVGEYRYAWYLDEVLSEVTDSVYTVAETDLGKTLKCVLLKPDGTQVTKKSIYLSKLSVVTIDTETGKDVTSKVDYISADLNIYGNKDYAGAVQYSGKTEIRGRGNTSWTAFPKKSYKLKLDKKTNIFGMGENKHWVLISCYWDEDFLRNKMSYDLSGEMGLTYMASDWVDVYLNGNYAGVYLLCEQIRVGKSRVNIYNWEDTAGDIAKAVNKQHPDVKKGKLEDFLVENLGWVTQGRFTYNGVIYKVSDYYKKELPSVNGGYLLEMDTHDDEVSSFKTGSKLNVNIKRPEFLKSNSTMLSYIKTYVSAFEDACCSEDFTTEYGGKRVRYNELCNMDSMVKWWMVNEVFFNWDAGYNSNFMYKDVDGKLTFGPIWDMDITAAGYGTSDLYDRWQTWFYKRNPQMNLWYKEVVADPYFVMLAEECYWKYRPMFENMIADGGYMEKSYQKLRESGLKNTSIWKWRNGYEKDYANMKQWLKNRLEWLDEQFMTEDTLWDSLQSQTSAAGVTDYGTITAYTQTDDVSLFATLPNGKALKEDTQNGAASAVFPSGNRVLLQISTYDDFGTNKVEILVNGTVVGTFSKDLSEVLSFLLTPEMLNAGEGNKNTVQVVGYWGDRVVSHNYLTLRGVTCTHPESAVQLLYKVTATCKEEGYSGDRVCADCGATLQEGKVLKKLPHKEKKVAGKKPTCTKAGYTESTVCTVCKATVQKPKTIKATGHKYGAWKTLKKATLYATGQKSRTCTVCKAVQKATISKVVLKAPTVSATAKSGSVKLSMKKVSGATGYEVYKLSGKSYKRVYKGKSTSVTVKGLKAGTTYTFRVRAYAVRGKKTATGSYTKLQCPAKLKTPSVSVSAAKKSLNVSYKKVSGATGYRVYYATSKNGKYQYAGATKSRKFTLRGLRAKKTYYVKVRAYKTVNGKNYYSSYSTVIRKKTR